MDERISNKKKSMRIEREFGLVVGGVRHRQGIDHARLEVEKRHWARQRRAHAIDVRARTTAKVVVQRYAVAAGREGLDVS